MYFILFLFSLIRHVKEKILVKIVNSLIFYELPILACVLCMSAAFIGLSVILWACIIVTSRYTAMHRNP